MDELPSTYVTTKFWKAGGEAGEGEIDEATGVYTEPATIPVGSFAVIAGVCKMGGLVLSGTTAVPLPLSKYVDIIDSVNTSVRRSIPSLNA